MNKFKKGDMVVTKNYSIYNGAERTIYEIQPGIEGLVLETDDDMCYVSFGAFRAFISENSLIHKVSKAFSLEKYLDDMRKHPNKRSIAWIASDLHNWAVFCDGLIAEWCGDYGTAGAWRVRHSGTGVSYTVDEEWLREIEVPTNG